MGSTRAMKSRSVWGWSRSGWGSAVGVRVSLATGIITRNYATPPTSVERGPTDFRAPESLRVHEADDLRDPAGGRPADVAGLLHLARLPGERDLLRRPGRRHRRVGHHRRHAPHPRPVRRLRDGLGR